LLTKKGIEPVLVMKKEQNGLQKGDLHPLNKTHVSAGPLNKMEIMFVRKTEDPEGIERRMEEGTGLKMGLLQWCKTHVLAEPLSKMEIMFVRKIEDPEGIEMGTEEEIGLKMGLHPWCRIVALLLLQRRWRKRGRLKQEIGTRGDQ